MKTPLSNTTKGLILAFAVCLLTAGLVFVGCSGSSSSNTITAATTTSPVSITDASSNPILAVSMTIDSIVLTDTAGKTASILKNPAPFEAVHMDAVQEPFLVPPVPMDTYTSITITVANPTVAFIDPTTNKPTVATATLTTNTFTQNFSPAITVSAHTPLLFDFLVEKSVIITAGSPSTVAVTPTFNVVLAPLPLSGPPTNGTNGLLTGFKGHVTAIDTTDTPENFTITDGNGNSQVIDVDAACGSTAPVTGVPTCTIFETDAGTLLGGLSSGSIAVDALVEVDAEVQSNGTLLAVRVEVHDPGANPKQLFLGPVVSVTGTPATSFNMLVREQLGKGATPTAAPAIDTITLATAQFVAPPRLAVLAAVQPFTYAFNASTIFAGQHVAVLTTGATSGTAAANYVLLQPQALSGVYQSSSNAGGGYTKYVLTLPTNSWLATLTGYTNVNVFTNAQLQPITTTAGTPAAPVAGTTVLRFHGFLFRNTSTSTLELIADVQADPPGTPIIP